MLTKKRLFHQNREYHDVGYIESMIQKAEQVDPIAASLVHMLVAYNPEKRPSLETLLRLPFMDAVNIHGQNFIDLKPWIS